MSDRELLEQLWTQGYTSGLDVPSTGTTKSAAPGQKPTKGQLYFEDYDNEWDEFWATRLRNKYGIKEPMSND
mgnify:CR=1 FL=1